MTGSLNTGGTQTVITSVPKHNMSFIPTQIASNGSSGISAVNPRLVHDMFYRIFYRVHKPLRRFPVGYTTRADMSKPTVMPIAI